MEVEEEARTAEQRQREIEEAAGTGAEDDGGDKTTAGAAAKKRKKKKRGRVEMRRIEDRVSRQVRFSKRRSGLFKKAFELSVLCDAQVALVVFSPAGRLYEFASSNSSTEKIFGRYWDLANTLNDLNIEARDCWIHSHKQSAAGSFSDQLNSIAQGAALEPNVKDLSMAELRCTEETMTNALTVIKNKLMMKKKMTGLDPLRAYFTSS